MTVRMLTGDCRALLATLPDASVQCCVTSPPYFGLRDYGVDGQIGLEPTVDAYVAEMVAVFRAVRRVLRDDGVLFLNLGDSYAHGVGMARGQVYKRHAPVKSGLWKGTRSQKRDIGNNGQAKDCGLLKPKDLIGIPWRVAFALQQPWLTCRGCGAENHLSQWASFPNGRRICPACETSKGYDISESGWYLRSEIIWHKPNPMPESVRDRPTKSHEQIFLLTKSARYFWDAEAVKEKTVSLDPSEPSYRPNSVAISENGRKEFSAKHDMTARSYDPSGRNIRSVWTIATAPFAEAHFATFPPALAERCITAGTSEKGACSACGAPWVRASEQSNREKDRPSGAGWLASPSPRADGDAVISRGLGRPYVIERKTIGWQPTCAHCRLCDELGCNPKEVHSALQRPESGEGIRERIPAQAMGERAGVSTANQGKEAALSGHMRPLWDGVQGPGADESLLQPLMCGQGDLDGGNGEHLSASEAATGEVCDGTPAWSSDGRQTGTDLRTPSRDGRGAWQDVEPIGSCASQKREPARQPDRELGTSDAEHPRQAPHEAPPEVDSHPFTPDDPVPCLILDCFAGAGTVSLVAERLGRDSIYIDLSPDYAAMARKRVVGDAPLFACVE